MSEIRNHKKSDEISDSQKSRTGDSSSRVSRPRSLSLFHTRKSLQIYVCRYGWLATPEKFFVRGYKDHGSGVDKLIFESGLNVIRDKRDWYSRVERIKGLLFKSRQIVIRESRDYSSRVDRFIFESRQTGIWELNIHIWESRDHYSRLNRFIFESKQTRIWWLNIHIWESREQVRDHYSRVDRS